MFDRIIQIKRTKYYFAETAVGFAALILINIFFLPKNPGFLGIDPNPLWLVVVGIAARYGRKGALFSGILAAVIFSTYMIAFGGMDAFYDDLWLLRYPFLFILVGFIIGEVKTAFILREDYLTNRVQELKNLNDKLIRENDIIKEAHKDLTLDVATKQDTITVLNEITGRLKSIKPQEIYSGILESLKENLDAQECSFYEVEGGNLKLFKSIGWKDYYRRPETYELGTGLIGLAAKNKKVMSVKDIVLKKHLETAESQMIGDSILAIPVLGLEERVFGVASIEKMPLLRLTESSIQTAKVVCELAASSLNNAFAFKALGEKQIRDEKHNVFKYHYFLTRAGEEFLRSATYMIPLSAMAFRWPKVTKMPEDKRSALIESVITLLNSFLRAFDVLASCPVKNVPLVLLLATTSGAQAQDLKNKFLKHIKDYGLDKAISDEPIKDTITITSFDPGTMHKVEDFLKPLNI